jgi:hypothetical protein
MPLEDRYGGVASPLLPSLCHCFRHGALLRLRGFVLILELHMSEFFLQVAGGSSSTAIQWTSNRTRRTTPLPFAASCTASRPPRRSMPAAPRYVSVFQLASSQLRRFFRDLVLQSLSYAFLLSGLGGMGLRQLRPCVPLRAAAACRGPTGSSSSDSLTYCFLP